MPQHVRVCLKRELGLDPCPLDHPREPGSAKGCPTLGGEHKRRLGLLLAFEPPQRPQLVTEDRMGARCALLDPAHVERGGPEVHLVPPQVHQLGCP